MCQEFVTKVRQSMNDIFATMKVTHAIPTQNNDYCDYVLLHAYSEPYNTHVNICIGNQPQMQSNDTIYCLPGDSADELVIITSNPKGVLDIAKSSKEYESHKNSVHELEKYLLPSAEL